jgi:hypothetical protein
MHKKILMILLFILWALPTLADVDTAWVRRYDEPGPGNDSDGAQAIAVDGSGNAYVTGGSKAGGSDNDYATIKYYLNGDTAWVRRYNGPGNSSDWANAIVLDSSGNVYVTGNSGGSGTEKDYATIKYYSNGDTAWVRRYNGPGDSIDVGYAIAIDDSNNIYVTGGSAGSGTGFDYATIKYYPNGDTAWVRRYNGPGNSTDCAWSITVDASGNVYVTGCSDYDSFTEFAEYATIKYYPNGDTAWMRRYNGPGNRFDGAFAIAVDGSNNVYVTGMSWGGYGTDHEYATIKYYPNGDTAWVRRYNGPANHFDRAYAIAVDSSGNVYVTGQSAQSIDPEYISDYATIKYYPNGDSAWVRRYHGPGDSIDVATAIAVDSFDNIYVTGCSWSGTDYDYATIKYDSSGNELWVERYNGPGNGEDKAWAIAVYGCDTVYVTGESWGSGTGHDYATVKYFETGNYVQDETGDREKPSEFTLSQSYPNPFNQTTKIEFTLAKSGFVSLNIYDILGRKVKTLVSEHLSSGYKSVLWDGKNESGDDVASGIYFYQLKVGNFSETKKLVLLK